MIDDFDFRVARQKAGYFSRTEIARYLGVNVNAFRYLIETHNLRPTHRYGRLMTRYYIEADVAKLKELVKAHIPPAKFLKRENNA